MAGPPLTAASGSGVPSLGPLGITAARGQPGGRLPDYGQDPGRLQRAGRREGIERQALWLNPGILYRTASHNVPPYA